VQPLNFAPQQLAVCAHHPAESRSQQSASTAPASLAALSFAVTNLDSEDGSHALQESFGRLLGGIASALLDCP
tara:strand:- start:994 stop:1212 length:219 start_codon:yes stop_codon:yes gene_type:complete